MRRRAFGRLSVGAALLLSAAPRSARACLWDTDTLEAETRGVPDAVVTILGAYGRNPDKYYEMRRDRVQAALAERPDDLAGYDDVAVACDRLGQHDDAISWMEKKAEALARLKTPARGGDTPDHWYRYHANLGTFHAHRWLKRADRWEQVEELERARAKIAEAIEENPKAHFGRERYQLRVLEWLVARPELEKTPSFLEIEEGALMNRSDRGYLAEHGLTDAVEGLCGLITLGAAWRSFDVTAALARVLAADGRQSVAELASLRCFEILESGGQSLVKGMPTDPEALRGFLPRGIGTTTEARYLELRAKAKAWRERRDAYARARLDRGEHPDTHKDFWAGFNKGEHSRMSLAELGLKDGLLARARGCACSSSASEAASPGRGGAAALAVAAALLLGLRRRRR